jgi:hypothetical protein
MKVEKIRRRVMVMFLVVWVITATGTTVFLEAANGSYASNPFPADGAVIPGDMVIYLGNEYIWTRLIFVPGATAVEHTGYFSDDYSKVESRDPYAFLGHPPYGSVPGWEYTFFAGNPQVLPATQTLVRGMTYYWCVDETDALGTTYPGDVWEFTIQDYKASSPNPPNEVIIVETDVQLSWVPGFQVVEHDVYMGTSRENVNNAVYDPINPPPEYLGTVMMPSFMVTGLSENTSYYWRVDEVEGRMPFPIGGGTYYKGDVWEFAVRGYKAYSPNPHNWAVIEESDVPLSWLSGFGVEEHDVYMGTSWENVNNAVYDPINPPPEYLGTATEPSFMVTGLSGNTIYYWRVDEVSGRIPGGGTYYKGDVWSFTIFGSPVILIQGLVDFDPDILNLSSQGNWITSYIGLPEEYNAADIDPGSILLEGEIEPEQFWLTGDQQIAIVRFARSDVQTILEVGNVELTITGQLTDGTLFEAKDTIEVVDNQ